MKTHRRKSAERNGRLYKVLEDGVVVGHVELQGVDPVHRCVQIWRVLVDPAHRGDFNKPAIACYLHVGFKPEGVRRERLHGPDGKFWSEIVMSILSREWEAARP